MRVDASKERKNMKKYRIPPGQVKKMVMGRLLRLGSVVVLGAITTYFFVLGRQQEPQSPLTSVIAPIFTGAFLAFAMLRGLMKFRRNLSEMEVELTANEIIVSQGRTIIRRIALGQITLVRRLKNNKLFIGGSSAEEYIQLPAELGDIDELEHALLPYNQMGAPVAERPNPLKWYIGFGVVVALFITAMSTQGSVLSQICFGILTAMCLAVFIWVQTRKNQTRRGRVLSLILLSPLLLIVSRLGINSLHRQIGGPKMEITKAWGDTDTTSSDSLEVESGDRISE